ncbi:MAG TPA: phosphoribosylanthranilate isomerase [Thermoanaerobaculia bacterium]|nr:phosphoribosylanthranilate isomerase [Thermoanaerobaculia bacterium]
MTAGPKVKVCGVTRPEDALLAAELGADYLGLNFVQSSPRYLTIERAREIAAAVRGRFPSVGIAGVFVNHPPAEVEAIDREVGLDLLQFSGDEGADEVNRYARRAIKVFRTGGDPGPAALAAYPDVWALLVDARHGVLYGGTGLAWPYAAVADLAARRRVFVAGGLRPGNVGPALAGSRPYGIDVCSGVESAPGIKDRTLLERLFVEVRNGQGTPSS